MERCLASAAPFVDEIVIVDTGSADRTLAIAESYGAIIIHHRWQEDFAQARNVGLEHATGDWVLWLDADEELEAADGEAMRESLATEKGPLLLVELINYYGADPPDPLRCHILAHHRLFRNGIGLRFVNPIHEQLNVNEVITSLEPPPTIKARIYHYGYMDDIRLAKDKSGRNIRMLQEQKKLPDYSPWIDYHLASEWLTAAKYDEAIKDINLAITRFLQIGQLPPSLVYKLKYAALLESGHAYLMWPAIDKAIQLYPDYVDLRFYQGIALLLRGNLREAENSFNQCLAMGETCTTHLTMKGAGSFLAYFYRGECRRLSGRLDLAQEDYKETLKQNPQFVEAEQAKLKLETGRKGSEVNVTGSHT
ncbi:hypothetical protein PA598K_02899 [Paenibacillus sp. 598K]|nr:hypothetical protein PA598K_02899 [Paenibacillus sp. 598K]